MFDETPVRNKAVVGLAVMDIQTLHRGHNNLLNEMRMVCDRAIIGIGSVRKSGVPGHPFSYSERVEMVRLVHGEFFDFVPLDDIDASADFRDWYAYVLMKIGQAELPEPTDYFSGSRIDAKWYGHVFGLPDGHPSDRTPVSEVYSGPEGRRLHIVDRTVLGLPSGREVRLLIETRDQEWRQYVPERLQSYIEMRYPPHLRQPVRWVEGSIADRSGNPVSDYADFEGRMGRGEIVVNVDGVFAVGTRLAVDTLLGDPFVNRPDSTILLELKDDGKWRPISTVDEKADWAAKNSKETI